VIFSFVCQTVTAERTMHVISNTGRDLMLEHTNCLLNTMYGIQIYFDTPRNLHILEENALLLNQIICCCKLDK
jgi:hypothetical protein